MENYKCIIALNNGAKKILRGGTDVVAHIVCEFRKFQRSIFNDAVKLTIQGVTFVLNDVKSFLFINEWTGERLEIS